MKIYKLLFLITVSMFFSANAIQAIDCRGYGTLADEFKSSTAVFSGKVIAQEYKRVTDTSYTDVNIEVLHVKLKVDRWWKGSGDVEVIVQPGLSRGPGYTRRSGDTFYFTSNESYLVFASASKGSLRTSDCSRTKTLDKAEEELKVLGEGFLPKAEQKCPTIAITPPDGKDKDTWTFSVRVENVEPNLKLTYKWTVRYGHRFDDVKSGQGTPSITIDTRDTGEGLLVEVEIGGLEAGCPNKAWVSSSH